MEEKKARNNFPLAGMRLFFKKWISPMASPCKKNQVHRKLVSTRRNGEFV